MKRLFLSIILFLLAYCSFAANIPVSPDTFVSAYNQATDGDVLLLDAGVYSTAVAFPTGKAIILKADPAAATQPVLNFQLDAPSGADGSLTFDGLMIDREGADYFFNSPSTYYMTAWKFENCTIKNIKRALFNSTVQSGNISSFVIDKCLITACGTSKTSFIFTSQTVDVFTVTNSTVYNFVGGDFFHPNNATTSKNITVSFINNTMYKCIWDKGYGWVSIGYVYPPGNTYLFRNNIFDTGANTDPVSNQPLLVYRGNGTVTEENNIKVNYQGNNSTTTNATNLTLNSGVLAGYTAVPYTDATSGDLTIASTTPFANAGIGGNPIGSPQLIKVIGQAATLTAQSFPVGAGTVSPSYLQVNQGDLVSVSAVRNFGFQFKHWKDQDDNIVSTEPDFKLNLNADMTLTAVFDALTTYNFTATVSGSQWGSITMNPVPVNGKYEQGTEVLVTAVSNPIANFLNWEDQSTNPVRNFIVNSDQTLTASFDEIPFITGWDFKSSVNINRPGDFYSETANVGSISAFEYDDTKVSWRAASGFTPSYSHLRLWTDKDNFNAGNVRYLKADFSTEGWRNIQVKSMVAGDWQGYAVYKLQYSIDNAATFVDVPGATVNIESLSGGGYKSTWSDLNATLPADAENLQRVHIRWIADKTSNKLDKTGAGTDVEGTAFANIFIFADKEVINDAEAPVLVSIVPQDNSTTATVNGAVVLTFNERVKSGAGDITLASKTINGVFGAKTATFSYEKLNYDTDYTFTIPPGALTDMSGNAYEGIILNFSTTSRTEPVKSLFNVVVAQDGSGDYTSVIDALNAAPSGRQIPWVIFIKNGTYIGHHVIPIEKSFIHLIGQSRDGVIIKDNLNADNGGVAERSTMVVQAENCYFENFIIENTYGYIQQNGPMAEALYTNNDKFAMKNVYIRSYQDTYLTSGRNTTDRHYIVNSRIEGAVDFIYGGGNVFFDKDTLTVTRAGSFIVAPAHSQDAPWGYVFKDNVINQNTDKVTGNINSLFGRPWQNAPKAVFINSKLLTGINPEGWAAWYTAPAIFADYGTMDANGNLVDLSQRRSSYTRDGNPVTAKNSLTDQEAATYTYENIILRSGDSWDPRMIAEAPEQPVNVKVENALITWDATAYTRLYVIIRNNEVIGFSTTNQFTDNTAVSGTNYSYKIQAASEYGALSVASEPVETLPVTGLKIKAAKVNQVIEISWSTLSEQGTSHFMVEKTTDGINFDEIGKVNAYDGNSHQTRSYSLTDNNPNFGNNIYRVAAVDFDGRTGYSALVAVDFGKASGEVEVFPNPVASVLKVQTGFTKSTIRIFNLSGQVMVVSKIDGESGEFNVSDFPAGIYIVEVDNGMGKLTARFIKK